MKAEELRVVSVLTEGRKYIIPPYQRPYSWSEEHAIQLVEDIYDSFKEGIGEYFIGSLICINTGDEAYEIVDGQQRLTTLSLIIAKIRDNVNNQGVKNDLQNRILPIDAYSGLAQEPRLKVRKKEEELYVKYILHGKKEYIPDKPTHTENLFINNFNEIEKYLKDNFSNDEELLAKFAQYILKNVFIIFVQTNNFSSSYRLFNVLNTRGLSLNQSDLLKNQLFEVAEKNGKSDSNSTEQYWNEIEYFVGIENIDKFLTLHEISKKTNRSRGVTKDKLTELLNSSLEKECKNDVSVFLRHLKKSAENYQKIKDNKFGDNKSKRTIQLFEHLKQEWDLTPTILAFLNKYGENNLLEFIVIFEKCYLHCWFSGKTKGFRESFCYDTIANINTMQSFEAIKGGLIKHADNNVLMYLDGDICVPFSKKLQLLKYVLLKIDQEMQDKSVSKSYSGTITIEHILPQKIDNAYWTSRFSDEEHKAWVHKLGNLTLLSGNKNSKAQNDGFDKKLNIYKSNGKNVSFDIAKNVLEYQEWNLENLKHRHEWLLRFARKIWWVE